MEAGGPRADVEDRPVLQYLGGRSLGRAGTETGDGMRDSGTRLHPPDDSESHMARSTELSPSLALTNLLDSIPVTPESTTSRVVVTNPTIRVVVFAFDQGELLTDHSSPRAVVVHLLDGRVCPRNGASPASSR